MSETVSSHYLHLAHVDVSTDDHHDVIISSASNACWRDWNAYFYSPLNDSAFEAQDLCN